MNNIIISYILYQLIILLIHLYYYYYYYYYYYLYYLNIIFFIGAKMTKRLNDSTPMEESNMKEKLLSLFGKI